MSGGWAATWTRHRRVLVICALVQALLGWLAVEAFGAGRNNLAANGSWVVSKTRVARGLMGAYAFLGERQALAGGELHLDAWHGYHEVVLARPLVEPRSIEFAATLGDGGWLAASFNREGEGPYDALRLSTHRQVENAFLRVAEDGAFLRRRPLPAGLARPGTRHRVRLDLEPERVVVRLDDRTVGELAVPRLPLQRIGFRGGRYPAAVDDVVVTGAGGERWVERFSGPAPRRRLAAGVAAGLVLLGLALFLALARRAASGRRLGFAFLTAHLTLLVCGLALFAYARARIDWYPGRGRLLEARDSAFREGERERVVDELLARLESTRVPRRRRVLFVGSSQTWGAGASRLEDAFVRRVEDLLNEPYRRPRYLCLNLGVPAARARHLVPLVRRLVPRVEPGLVVVNLSSNDRAAGDLTVPLRKIVRRALAAGARPVLVLEANAPESMSAGLAARHAEMRAVGAELDLPTIDLHGHLAALADTGFLWWDSVHLTSYGQRLAAEELFAEIGPLLAGDAGGREEAGPPGDRLREHRAAGASPAAGQGLTISLPGLRGGSLRGRGSTGSCSVQPSSSASRRLISAHSGSSSSVSTMASIGHSGLHRLQSMQLSGSITRNTSPLYSPGCMQSTGQTSTQVA